MFRKLALMLVVIRGGCEELSPKASFVAQLLRSNSNIRVLYVFRKEEEKFKEKKPVHYSMSGSFKENDVIDHKTFGMGIVISASYQKMEVVFSDRSRILVFNR